METEERLRRRASFDAIPDIYDAGRPSYPDELYIDLLSRIDSPAGNAPDVLEVGCGTGQASRSLLAHGCLVTAVELGPRLAEKAKENLAVFGDQFRVIVGDFEQVALPSASFDLVASASAFHWIDPAVGFPKAIELLHPNGMLALWGMGEAHDDTRTAFADDVHIIYEELGIPQRAERRWKHPLGAPRGAAAIEDSGLFGPVEIHGYPCDITYTSERYLQLVASYSGFQTMPVDVQETIRERVGTLIDKRYGGSVVRPAVATLCLASPLPARLQNDRTDRRPMRKSWQRSPELISSCGSMFLPRASGLAARLPWGW